ncbi:MAG: hypothetical protein U9R00_01545 [Patescibacteria group bacterium]|nr:hypothetical protein [Patescibacteria group bacterium]
MKRKLTIIEIVLVLTVFGLGVNYLQAYVSKPGTVKTNDIIVVDTGDEQDYIDGKLLIGNTGLASTELEVDGLIFSGGLRLSCPSSPGNLYVGGTITTNLTGPGNVCVTTDGKLIKC